MHKYHDQPQTARELHIQSIVSNLEKPRAKKISSIEFNSSQ